MSKRVAFSATLFLYTLNVFKEGELKIMSYQITEKLISNNRSYKVLQPQGIVVHSTANLNATAMNHYNYFNSAYRGASAHYFIDDQMILRLISENECAWHAGQTANSRFLSVELCEFDDSRFDIVWQKAIWFVADVCKRYGWNTDPVWSHRGVSQMWHETDHIDPIPYFKRHNKTWDEFLQAVKNEIDNKEKKKIQGGNYKVNCLLLYTKDDLVTGARIAEKFNGNCAIFIRLGEKHDIIPSDVFQYEKLYIVGGGSVGHKNEEILSGNSWWDTIINTKNKLGF